MAVPIPRRVVPSVEPAPLAPARVAREFRALLAGGARLRPAGEARTDPQGLLRRGYTPRHRISLFDTDFWLTGVRQNPEIRFFVAYVAQRRGGRPARSVYPRIFYKDVSLVWRSASHYIRTDGETWIGKGEARVVVEDGYEYLVSDEDTTNLPLEMQTALETVLRTHDRVPTDNVAVDLVLRRGSARRIAPYADFSAPRRRAQEDPRNLLNGGRPIARFTRRNDPTSLRFARGFEPDLEGGVLEVAATRSRLYGGTVERYRVVSRNRLAQYLFFAGPRHVWIGAGQATTTELSSFGVRTIDAPADEDLFMPGYEYDLFVPNGDAPEATRQIPAGFEGAPSEVDPQRSDTTRWLDQVPIIREFRRVVLKEIKGDAVA